MTAASSTAGLEIELLIPDNDEPAPLLSIVIPALNEELTIADFVAWCKQGLAEAGVRGEILIVDSSTDATSAIACEHGARVLRTPKRGLGRAYIDAIPFIRGRYVLMGDADCTYDFRRLSPFVRAFEQGHQFVMGSRFKGYIEPHSMPPLHQYLGTPVTTQILNVIYQTLFSDIHCGMRGLTRDALAAMDLASQSWEYASEMVLKSVQMRLRTTEVPVRFLRDKEGRLSHHKRSGWLSPWKAAWINLRAMGVRQRCRLLSDPPWHRHDDSRGCPRAGNVRRTAYHRPDYPLAVLEPFRAGHGDCGPPQRVVGNARARALRPHRAGRSRAPGEV